jgi:hypothetical protein
MKALDIMDLSQLRSEIARFRANQVTDRSFHVL